MSSLDASATSRGGERGSEVQAGISTAVKEAATAVAYDASAASAAIAATEDLLSAHPDVTAGMPSCLRGISREDAEVVFFGTGSSQPSKHRGLSSILLHRFEKGCMLMDCGEGTLAQMMRR